MASLTYVVRLCLLLINAIQSISEAASLFQGVQYNSSKAMASGLWQYGSNDSLSNEDKEDPGKQQFVFVAAHADYGSFKIRGLQPVRAFGASRATVLDLPDNQYTPIYQISDLDLGDIDPASNLMVVHVTAICETLVRALPQSVHVLDVVDNALWAEPKWVAEASRLADGVLVASLNQAKLLQSSGMNVPAFVVPHHTLPGCSPLEGDQAWSKHTVFLAGSSPETAKVNLKVRDLINEHIKGVAVVLEAEKDFSVAQGGALSDDGPQELCDFLRTEVTVNVAWWSETVRGHKSCDGPVCIEFKPAERLTNAMGAGVPSIGWSRFPSIEGALGADAERWSARDEAQLIEKLEGLLFNKDKWLEHKEAAIEATRHLDLGLISNRYVEIRATLLEAKKHGADSVQLDPDWALAATLSNK